MILEKERINEVALTSVKECALRIEKQTFFKKKGHFH